MRRIPRIAAAALALLLLHAPAGHAGVETVLSDRNSVLDIGSVGQEEDVRFLWFVEEEFPLATQDFSLFVGDEEIAVPELEPNDFQFTDTNPFVDDSSDTAALRYQGDGYVFDVSIMLRGGPFGSAVSDLAETIIITNELDFDLFFVQRVEVIGVDAPFGEVVNENTVRITGSGGFVLEEVVTPGWDTVSVGGSEFGFELGWSIAPGETLLISKDKRVFVPEPSTAALFGLGIFALGVSRRR